ncbi:ACP phosphodiesterase [Geoanaerobacter pelophilus]|uniref:ACP phosphodiesterase n=1 Tax=Geoanaerobacter pelophilus TaxID=60036 RepID=A0ABQ0MHC3_9BACT|nr:ACP phosphodiesterase [Geoanaerobacter pelophilus]GAW66483.1 ACP phosphodiesterase [Geoanaerobacter pelophilus]
MNYLFHLYLSGDDPGILTGNFMGDFVKGPLDERFPPPLARGIQLHRRIDSFAQDDPHFTRSRQTLSPHFGLYRGILVDLYYDHFLAAGWESLTAEPLPRYLERARLAVEQNRRHLPERLRDLVPVIFEELIPSYLSVEGVGKALSRMSRRITRSNPLSGGGEELTRHYLSLQEDFRGFLPSVEAYAERLRTAPSR